MRVWELADELGVTSADALDLIRPHDAYVTSHLAAVPRQALDAIRASPPQPRWTEGKYSDTQAGMPASVPNDSRSPIGPHPGRPPRRYRRRPGPKVISFEPPYEEDDDGYGNEPTNELRYEPIWSTRDVARYLGISPATVRQWVQRGHVQPCGRQGPSHIFERDDILTAAKEVAARRKQPGRPTSPLPTVPDSPEERDTWPRSDAPLASTLRRRPGRPGPLPHGDPPAGVGIRALSRLAAVTPDALVTTAEAAALLGLSPSTIRSWVRRGHLAPATPPDNRNDRSQRYFRLVDAYHAARRPPPRASTPTRRKGRP